MPIDIHSYFLLLATAFLAASLLPGSPDTVLVLMVTNRANVALSIAVATVGSYLGACLNYYLGRGIGRVKFLEKFRPSEEELRLSTRRYVRYGRVALLFSWVPFVGDPLTCAAGFMKLGLLEFSLWVLAGRLVRFWVVAILALQVTSRL